MKIGLKINLQFGHIAGAESTRLAQRIPAINVPCEQAILVAFLQAPICESLTVLILDYEKNIINIILFFAVLQHFIF